MAQFVADFSEDKSKQVGAVIVRDNRVISQGYNGLPTGVLLNEERQERPLKYSFFEHGERNAIYTAAKMGHAVNGSTMYCNWYPCTDCARAIIQSGIIRLVTSRPDPESSWIESMMAAETMMLEAGVELNYSN
jgi:dCMP deaminase